MATAWLIDSRTIATKVKNASFCPAKQARDSGAKRECPNCHHWINNSDVCYEWPGLPAGVKFDPSDVELLDHLAAKCGVRDAKPHTFIDEFIPTVDEDKGICYTHPNDLPGSKKDGTSFHFFHKSANAYASGQRKRRKVQSAQTAEAVRWHKTGKTKPVIDINGFQKGCKKIMVLYRCSNKGSKPVKSSWVMHQYHLGTEEDEKEGEYVVSKIYYQQKETDKKNDVVIDEEPPMVINPTGPKTPKTITPNPPRPGSFLPCQDLADQDINPIGEASTHESSPRPKEQPECEAYAAGESQAVDLDPDDIEDSLLCKEILRSSTSLADDNVLGTNDMAEGTLGGSYGIPELENLDFDTPPDFSLADIPFFSQDSIFDWLDRL